MPEHTIRLHTCKTDYLFKLVTCYLHISRLIALHGIYYVVNFILFSLENDDMESSKRCVNFLSLIFIIRCLTKSNLIRELPFLFNSRYKAKIVIFSPFLFKSALLT